MTELSLEFKKWLTEEVLGECSHKWNYLWKWGRIEKCDKCGMEMVFTPPSGDVPKGTRPEDFERTFDNWNDVGLVIEALVKKQWFIIDVTDAGLLYVTPEWFFSTLQEYWEKEKV